MLVFWGILAGLIITGLIAWAFYTAQEIPPPKE